MMSSQKLNGLNCRSHLMHRSHLNVVDTHLRLRRRALLQLVFGLPIGSVSPVFLHGQYFRSPSGPSSRSLVLTSSNSLSVSGPRTSRCTIPASPLTVVLIGDFHILRFGAIWNRESFSINAANLDRQSSECGCLLQQANQLELPVQPLVYWSSKGILHNDRALNTPDSVANRSSALRAFTSTQIHTVAAFPFHSVVLLYAIPVDDVPCVLCHEGRHPRLIVQTLDSNASFITRA